MAKLQSRADGPGWNEVAPLALNGCFYPARFHAYCPPVHYRAIPIR